MADILQPSEKTLETVISENTSGTVTAAKTPDTVIPAKTPEILIKESISAYFNQLQKNGEIHDINDLFGKVKDLVRGGIEACLQGEMDAFLGYQKNSHEVKTTQNRRNGYTKKTLKTDSGKIDINTPRDRFAEFQPVLIGKRETNVSNLETTVLTLYAKGMSQRDIADTIEKVYCYSISAETVSAITDRVSEVVTQWQNRPLEPIYVSVYVDCIYVSIKTDRETKQHAVYVAIGVNLDGMKDILGFWIGETESKHAWMKIFDEWRVRGVKDIIFLCVDGVTGVEEGVKIVFPDVIVQRCIVHLMRNALHFVPRSKYAAFARDAKKLYTAPNLEAAEQALSDLEKDWGEYSGAVDVWKRNWSQVEQLYQYGSSVRKSIYTTNVVESVNSSLRKVTKRGAFPSKDAVFKAFYLRAQELKAKWTKAVHGWSNVMNELFANDAIRPRLEPYINKR